MISRIIAVCIVKLAAWDLTFESNMAPFGRVFKMLESNRKVELAGRVDLPVPLIGFMCSINTLALILIHI